MGMKYLRMMSLVSLMVIQFSSCTKELVDDGQVGPCVHEYKEAIFHIIDLRDSSSNTQIMNAKVTDVKINGRNQSGPFIGTPNYGMIFLDSTYDCTIPFGFGYEKGSYELKMIVEGYQDKIVKYENVDYSIYVGGCPSYNDGGQKISVLMKKK